MATWRKKTKQKNKKQAEPTSQNRLQETLKAFAADGERHSVGVFTIDADKAALKLGAFQLPSPEFWILILVQAANRGEADRVKIHQSTMSTTVEIQGLAEWEWSEIQPYLTNPSDDGSFLTSLAVAFRALAASRDGHDFKIITPAGESVQRTTEQWLQEPASFFERGRKNTVIEFQHLAEKTKKLSFWPRRKAAQCVQLALLTAVQDGAIASPVLVTVDGWQANSMFRTETVVKRQILQRLVTSTRKRFVTYLPVHSKWLPSTKFPLPSVRPDPVSRTKAREEWAGVGVLSYLIQEQETLWKNPADTNYAAQTQAWKLHWVKDGIVIQTEGFGFESLLQMNFFVNANGLATDLSGLTLLSSEERVRRKQISKECLHAQISEFVQSSPDQFKINDEMPKALQIELNKDLNALPFRAHDVLI